MTDKKWREFFLHEDKKDIQTFGIIAFEEQHYDDDIHVIEYQAYEELKDKYDKVLKDEIGPAAVKQILTQHEQIQELQKKLEIAKEALEFYAEPGVWGIAGPGERVSVDPCDWQKIEVGEMRQLDMRGGKRARQALKQIEETQHEKQRQGNNSTT